MTFVISIRRTSLDLATGDELLEKTRAGNPLLLFGEPDLQIKKKKTECCNHQGR